VHFIDTNMLVGAADRGDDLHAIGREILTQVAKGRFGGTILCDFVLDETLTILSKRKDVGPKIAGKFVRALLESPRIRCVFVDEPLFMDALGIFERYGQPLSFTDATIVAVMRAQGCDTLFSNDDDFDRIPGIVRRTEAT